MIKEGIFCQYCRRFFSSSCLFLLTFLSGSSFADWSPPVRIDTVVEGLPHDEWACYPRVARLSNSKALAVMWQ